LLSRQTRRRFTPHFATIFDMPARAVDGGQYTDVESLVRESVDDVIRSRARGVKSASPSRQPSRPRGFFPTQFGVAWDKRHASAFEHGELITQFVFVIFVALTHRLRTENISLCGFMEYAPNWHGALYYWSATASGNSLIWGTARAMREEHSRWMKLARFLCGAAPVISLYGTMIFPRCAWTPHQRYTKSWAWSVTFAMGFEWIADVAHRKLKPHAERAVVSDLSLAQLAWCVGLATTTTYYYTSSYNFFSGEILCAMSFSWWIMSKHRAGTFATRPDARVYTWREYCLQDGAAAAALLCVFRFQQNACSRA